MKNMLRLKCWKQKRLKLHFLYIMNFFCFLENTRKLIEKKQWLIQVQAHKIYQISYGPTTITRLHQKYGEKIPFKGINAIK